MLVRNSLLGFVPQALGVVISVVTVPLYLNLVGPERYGALLMAFVFLGYFGQADFGLGRAVTQRLSAIRDHPPSEWASVVWSAIAGASVISLAGACLIYLATSWFFQSSFDVAPVIRAEILRSTWLFALFVPLIMFTGVASGALAGLERFEANALGTTLANTLSQVLPLVVAAFHSLDFAWLLGASLLGRVAGLVPILVSMVRFLLRGHPVAPSRTHLHTLFSYGSWIMVTAIVGPLMWTADRLVIGGVLGAVAVVAYSVPAQIAQRTALFPMAISQALFPRLAAKADAESLALGKVSVVFVGQLYALLVIGLICLAAPLMALWLGDKLDPRSVWVGQIILAGWWINGLAGVPYTLIQARGNSRYTAMLHVFELPIYAILLYALGAAFGLAGVALAFAARMLLDCALLFHKGGLLETGVIARLAWPAALMGVALAAAPLMQDWLSALAGASVLSTALLAVTWFQMPEQVRDWLHLRLGRR